MLENAVLGMVLLMSGEASVDVIWKPVHLRLPVFHPSLSANQAVEQELKVLQHQAL